jgi:hypothetical protein
MTMPRQRRTLVVWSNTGCWLIQPTSQGQGWERVRVGEDFAAMSPIDPQPRWLAKSVVQGKSGCDRTAESIGLMMPTAFPSGSSTTAYLAPQKASYGSCCPR